MINKPKYISSSIIACIFMCIAACFVLACDIKHSNSIASLLFIASFIIILPILSKTKVGDDKLAKYRVNEDEIIFGDTNGFEISPQEAFGYVYSNDDPGKLLNWIDPDYISNKLSSRNMFTRVPLKRAKGPEPLRKSIR